MPKLVLTVENLALHTEHYKKLDQKRDFVAEFIHGLVPTAPPRVNPIRSTRLSDDESTLRKIQPKTDGANPDDRQRAQPITTTKATVTATTTITPPKVLVEGRASRPQEVDMTESTAVGKKKRTRKEAVSTTPRTKESPRLAGGAFAPYSKHKDNHRNNSKSKNIISGSINHNSHPHQEQASKNKAKRKSVAVVTTHETSDLDVENLVINDADKAMSTSPVGGQAAKTISSNSSNSFVRDDPKDSQLRSAKENHEVVRHRKPLERVDKEDNIQNDSNRGHHYRHQRHHHHEQQYPKQQPKEHHHRLHHPHRLERPHSHHDNRSKERLSDEEKVVKSNRNKPRKILTQGSLVMNQFKSSKIAKDKRITIPESTGRLGIFKKGKASRKVAVNRGFSESSFLDRHEESEYKGANPQNTDIVTSNYFAPQKKTRDKEDKAFMSSDLQQKTDSNSTGSEHSLHSLQQQRKRKATSKSKQHSRHASYKKRGRRYVSPVQSNSSEEDQDHKTTRRVTQESSSASGRSSDNVLSSLLEESQHGGSMNSYHPESSMDHEKLGPGPGLFDEPSACPVQELTVEPPVYYTEGPQGYMEYEYNPALYSYPIPFEYHSTLLPASSSWSEPWAQEIVLQSQQLQQPAQAYFPTLEVEGIAESVDASPVDLRAHTHPPQAQFYWRPRRLY
ncbi:hypothetical protein BGZ83_000073 [Gryganskiella cystojenkinii]|nr:hypothetical protein BGZ83_000073 [Gryganskiella cystojenkinii]